MQEQMRKFSQGRNVLVYMTSGSPWRHSVNYWLYDFNAMRWAHLEDFENESHENTTDGGIISLQMAEYAKTILKRVGKVPPLNPDTPVIEYSTQHQLSYNGDTIIWRDADINPANPELKELFVMVNHLRRGLRTKFVDGGLFC